MKIDNLGFWKPRRLPSKSLLKCLEYFDNNNLNCIVEIGSGLKGDFNGNSILTWIKSKSATKIYCVDISKKTILEMKKKLNDNRITYFTKSGEIFFKSYKYEKIDLLYLDYWTGNLNTNNYVKIGKIRAKSHINMYKLSYKYLSPKAMILIDDTDHIEPWKQTLIVKQAKKDGFIVKWKGRQTLLVRKNYYE